MVKLEVLLRVVLVRGEELKEELAGACQHPSVRRDVVASHLKRDVAELPTFAQSVQLGQRAITVLLVVQYQLGCHGDSLMSAEMVQAGFFYIWVSRCPSGL